MSSEGTGFISEAASGRNRFVVRLAFIAAIGGFLFGYDTGVISGALLFLKKDLGASSFEQQAVVGSLLLGAVGGAVLAGYLADAISRRRTMFIAGVIYVGAALWSALAGDAWSLIIARFILGIAVGTASFVAPMYIAELTPPRIRGGTVSFNQLMVVTGILVAYLVNFAFKGVADNWRWMLGLGALPGIALAVGMLLLPYSPRWLVEKHREEEAEDVLHRARGEDDDIGEEMGEIERVTSEEASLRDLVGKGIRPMLIVGLALAIFQQLIGVNTVIYYAPTILKATGASSGGAIGQTVFIGVTNVVFTIVAVLLLDRLGRRAFLLTGTIGCVVSLITLGLYFQVPALQHHADWLALVSLIVYIASFAMGLGPVFWLMISEIFPLRIRGPAMAACTVANWAFNFAVSFTFLSLVGAVGRPGTFWIYAGLGVIALTFFSLRVPETRGRSLEEIERDLGADPGDAEGVREQPLGGRERGAPAT